MYINYMKIIREGGRSLLTILNGAVVGLVGGLVYIGTYGFNCVVDNTTIQVWLHFKGLNVSQILNGIVKHNGTYGLPISISATDNDPMACIEPLLVAASIGVTLTAGYELFRLGSKCSERRQQKRSAVESGGFLALNEDPPQSSGSSCCI